MLADLNSLLTARHVFMEDLWQSWETRPDRHPTATSPLRPLNRENGNGHLGPCNRP